MEKLLNRREVADLLGVPFSTLELWAQTGSGPRYAIVGKHSRYRPSDVEAWLESRSRDQSVKAS